MSEPLRIAVAVEGPTDRIALQAILAALMPNRDFVLQVVQPEGSRMAEMPQASPPTVAILRYPPQTALPTP